MPQKANFYLENNKSLDISPKFTSQFSIEVTDLKKGQNNAKIVSSTLFSITRPNMLKSGPFMV